MRNMVKHALISHTGRVDDIHRHCYTYKDAFSLLFFSAFYLSDTQNPSEHCLFQACCPSLPFKITSIYILRKLGLPHSLTGDLYGCLTWQTPVINNRLRKLWPRRHPADRDEEALPHTTLNT